MQSMLHDVRLRFQIDTSNGGHDSLAEVDISVPSQSTFSELVPEVLGLAQQVSEQPLTDPEVPVWQVISPAGLPYDMYAPVHTLQLSHGNSMIIRPHRPQAAPVIRDSAEALAHCSRSNAAARGTTECAAMAGALVIVLLGLRLPVESVPLSARWGAIAALLSIAFVITTRPLLLIPWLLATWSSVFFFLLGDSFTAVSHATSLSIVHTVLAAGTVALVVLAGIMVAARVSLWPIAHWLSGIVTIVVCSFASAPAGWLHRDREFDVHGWFNGAASGVILCAVAVIVAGPSLALRVSAMPIPRLPNTGQDLTVSDKVESPSDMTFKAQKASAIFQGMYVGSALSLAFAMAYLAVSPSVSGYCVALCTFTTIVCVFHAHRCPDAYSTWALWAAGMLGMIAATNGALDVFAWPWIVVSILAAGSTISAPVWVHKLSSVAPTTTQWLHRVESLAVAAIVPLAAHLMGIFSLIRGLG